MSEARGFEFEGMATPAEAADVLRRIAEGIRRGSFSLSMGSEPVPVSPEGELALDIEASDRKGKSKIEIAVAWTRAGDEGDEDDD
jgi:amphi-Trp domain-containing protein